MKQLRLLIFAVFPNWDITNYPSGDKKNLNNALSLSGYSVITVKYFMPETELIKMNWWISVSLACFIYIIHLYQVLIITRHFHCMKNCPNTEFFLTVFSCIHSECKKIRTRKNSIFGQWFLVIPWLCSAYSKLKEHMLRFIRNLNPLYID